MNCPTDSMKKVKQNEEVNRKENVIGLVSVALAVIVVQTVVMLPSYPP